MSSFKQQNTASTGVNFFYVPDSAGKERLNGKPVTKIHWKVVTDFSSTNGKPDLNSGKEVLYYYAGFGGAEYKAATKNSGDSNWTLLKTAENRNVLGDAAAKELTNPKSDFSRAVYNQTLLSLSKVTLQTQPGEFPPAGTKINPSIASEILGGPPQASPTSERLSGGTNPSQGTPSGGSSEEGFTPEGSKLGKSVISTGIKARAQYASSSELKYPSEYDGNDFLTINMLRYVADPNLGLGANPNATGEGEKDVQTLDPTKGLSRPSQRLAGKKNVLATISLPIPANVSDGNLVGWVNGDLGPLQAYGAGAAARLMQSGFGVGEQAGKEVSAAGQGLKNNKDAAKTIITASLVSKILNISNKELLSRSTGAIFNPNSELLFNGPQLRTFTFSFKMTPRHKKEAIAIRKIIRTLKQGMAPKSTASGIFLAAPNIFELEFKYVDPSSKQSKRHPFLPVLKPCALQNLSVNYMPDGSYMTYGDGSMIAYDMTCTFAELEPIFDQDYDELEKTDKTDSKGNPIYDQDSLIGY